MKLLTKIQAAQELAKLINKPILYLSGLCWTGENGDEFIVPGYGEHFTEDGRLLAAPFLKVEKDWSSDSTEVEMFLSENEGFIVCEDEDELWKLYDLVYGDDGCNTQARTKAGYPIYSGEHRVYALTIHADGTLGTENT